MIKSILYKIVAILIITTLPFTAKTQDSELSLTVSLVTLFNKFTDQTEPEASAEHIEPLYFEYGLEYIKRSKNDKLIYYGAIKAVANGTYVGQPFDDSVFGPDNWRGEDHYSNDNLAIQMGIGKTLLRKKGRNRLDIITGLSLRLFSNKETISYKRIECIGPSCFQPFVEIDYTDKKIHPSIFGRFSWINIEHKKGFYNMRINLVGAIGLASVYTAKSVFEDADGQNYNVFSQYNGSYLGIGFSFGWIKGFKRVASSE